MDVDRKMPSTDRVETHVGEPALQSQCVLADQHVTGAVGQHAVPEPPADLLEAPEGLRADDSVDVEPLLLLERSTAASMAASNCAGAVAGNRPRRISRSRTSATTGPVSPRRATRYCR